MECVQLEQDGAEAAKEGEEVERQADDVQWRPSRLVPTEIIGDEGQITAHQKCRHQHKYLAALEVGLPEAVAVQRVEHGAVPARPIAEEKHHLQQVTEREPTERLPDG